MSFMGVVATASIMGSALLVYSQEIVPVAWRATSSGAVSTAMGLSSAAIALGGGHIVVGAGFGLLFLLCAMLTAVGALLFWAYFRVPPGAFMPVSRSPSGGPAVVPHDHQPSHESGGGHHGSS